MAEYEVHRLFRVNNRRTVVQSLGDRGAVLGFWEESAFRPAFIYRNGSALRLLPDYPWITPNAMNREGDVTGTLWRGSVRPWREAPVEAFVWRSGEMSRIDPLSGVECHPTAINRFGHAVGWIKAFQKFKVEVYDEWGEDTVTEQHDAVRAFVFRDGITTALDTLGGSDSRAYGINDLGQIIGGSFLPGNHASHAFCFDGITMTDLGTLGGDTSVAQHINNRSDIVGSSEDQHGKRRAFLINSDGPEMRDLGTLPGGTEAWAVGVNDTGWIVGTTAFPDGHVSACIWRDGIVMSLNELTALPPGSHITQAQAISDSGHILAQCHIKRSRGSDLGGIVLLVPAAPCVCHG
jgi:probable HAF family extracellular repeat protein